MAEKKLSDEEIWKIIEEFESLSPERGSEDYEIENPQRNPAARRAALEKLSR